MNEVTGVCWYAQPGPIYPSHGALGESRVCTRSSAGDHCATDDENHDVSSSESRYFSSVYALESSM